MRAWTAYYGTDAELVARAFALAYGARLDETSMGDLVAMLREEIEPWPHRLARHWSMRLGRWTDSFSAEDWCGGP